MSHLNDSKTRNLDDAINEDLIYFVVIYQSAVRFPFILRVMTR